MLAHGRWHNNKTTLNQRVMLTEIGQQEPPNIPEPVPVTGYGMSLLLRSYEQDKVSLLL